MRYKFPKGKLNPAKKLDVRKKIRLSKLGKLNPNWKEHKEKNCVICHKEFLPKDHRVKTCSIECMKKLQSKNNGMKNKVVAKKVHKKLSKLRKEGKFKFWLETEEGKKKISKISRKRALTNNPMWNKKISSIVAEKTGKRMLKEYAEGKRTPKTYHYYEYKKRNGEIVKLQSSYELAYAKYLDRNNIKWICHHEKDFPRLFYKLNKKTHTYLADFYLLKTRELVDTKSTYILRLSKEQRKLKAIYKSNPKAKLIILTEVDLLELVAHPKELNYVKGN